MNIQCYRRSYMSIFFATGIYILYHQGIELQRQSDRLKRVKLCIDVYGRLYILRSVDQHMILNAWSKSLEDLDF